jgi:DNA-binding MarR family transcriptional regulator
MTFILPARLEVLHQPVRLRIVATLHRQPSMGFAYLRDVVGATGGNLATHLERLEAAGYVRQSRAFTKYGIHARVLLTPAGASAFAEYLALLRAFLEGVSTP